MDGAADRAKCHIFLLPLCRLLQQGLQRQEQGRRPQKVALETCVLSVCNNK